MFGCHRKVVLCIHYSTIFISSFLQYRHGQCCIQLFIREPLLKKNEYAIELLVTSSYVVAD